MLIKVIIINNRHYRGRPTGTESKIVSALAIMTQRDHTLVVELQEAEFGFAKGHNISVYDNQIV